MRRVDHTDAVQPNLKAVSSVAWEIQDWNRNTRGADFPDGAFKVYHTLELRHLVQGHPKAMSSSGVLNDGNLCNWCRSC